MGAQNSATAITSTRSICEGHGNSALRSGSLPQRPRAVLDSKRSLRHQSTTDPTPHARPLARRRDRHALRGVYPPRTKEAVSSKERFRRSSVQGPASAACATDETIFAISKKRRPKSYPNIEAAIAAHEGSQPPSRTRAAPYDPDAPIGTPTVPYSGSSTIRRAISPYAPMRRHRTLQPITNRYLFFWGWKSLLPVPEDDPRYQA